MNTGVLVVPGSAGWRRSGGVTVAKLPGYTKMVRLLSCCGVFVDGLKKKKLYFILSQKIYGPFFPSQPVPAGLQWRRLI